MNILITGQYYWPESFKITDIAEELSARGHKVTVITGLPDYSTNYVPDEYRHFKNRHETRNGVEIFRVPIIARHTGKIRRAVNYISFFISSSLFARIGKFEPDVIFSYQTAPILMANPGIVLKKEYNKPLFLYCIDIWPDQIKVWNVREDSLLYKSVLAYSRYAYGSADVVGITSEPFREYLVNKDRVDPDRIIYIPQHADELNVKSRAADDGKIHLCFAGNISKQQNLPCLLKAVSKIKTKVPFLVDIYGNGTSYEEDNALCNALRVNDRVIFHGRVPKEKLEKEIYPAADAFLLTLCSEKQVGYSANTVPLKFQSYLSAGKPVLASIDGGASDIIKKCGCGAAVPADDADTYAEVLKDFIENPGKYEECGKKGIEYFEKNFRKDLVMDRIEEILKYMAAGNLSDIKGVFE